jgi:hypothetical protein
MKVVSRSGKKANLTGGKLKCTSASRQAENWRKRAVISVGYEAKGIPA